MSEPTAQPSPASDRRGAVSEVAWLFLRLGLTSFGGPAAHIALMREEVVRRRCWVDDQRFLDLLGATNLIPGPNSTEMAIHLGYVRAGWRGLVAAGALFILPAMLIVLLLAWAYVEYGSTPQALWLLYGAKPVIIAIVLHALLGLARTAIKGVLTAAVGAATMVLYLLGLNEVALLFGGALVVLAVHHGRRLAGWLGALAVLPILQPSVGPAGVAIGAIAGSLPVNLISLFLIFLKIGAVLYGSGYVLLAFLRADFVNRLGWLTDQQLLDAVAVGQFTPGPLLTTATFVGYVVAGWPGALLATLGIFLPSFVFVAATSPFIPRLRGSPWASSLLDGVNVAALGLMAAVTIELGRAALVDQSRGAVDLFAAALAFIALGAQLRLRINPAWLVLGGAAAGAARSWVPTLWL